MVDRADICFDLCPSFFITPFFFILTNVSFPPSVWPHSHPEKLKLKQKQMQRWRSIEIEIEIYVEL